MSFFGTLLPNLSLEELKMMENNIYGVFPAIAVRGITPIPNNDLRIEVGRKNSITALELAENKHNSNIVLLLQKNPTLDNVGPKDLFPIAVLGKITLKVKLPNGNFKVKFKLIKRVEVLEYLSTNEYFTVSFKDALTVSGNPDEEVALVKMIADTVLPKAKELFTNAEDVISTIQSGCSTEVACDKMSFNLKTTDIDKIVYLV